MRRRFRAFLIRGVFWRKFLDWAVNNITPFYEPLAMFFWSLFFMFFAAQGRNAVMYNLRYILPGSRSTANLFRTFRVFWSFAWTIADTSRFSECRTIVDWEFDGYDHFRRLIDSSEGSIILTAHMGNYDLGAYLFVEQMKRQMTIVRAPERDHDTQQYVAERRERIALEDFRVDYSNDSSRLVFDLVDAIREGKVVAIQGDRVVEGVSRLRTSLFGLETDLPSGPFALAMATRAPIYPLFIIRVGRRRYRCLTGEPIHCLRTSRSRDEDIAHAMEAWRVLLERTIRDYWHQWYMFDPIEVAS